MELVIPDAARVHITISKAPLLALPQDSFPRQAASRAGHPVLKTLAVTALVFAAFQAGRFVPHQADARPAAHAAADPSPAAAAQLIQDAGSQPGPAGIPPAFQQQLNQPAQVVPPPGRPAPVAGAPGSAANLFGLQDGSR